MARNIVKVKEHKVKDGDSIKSLATANGMQWHQLAKFNFGTTIPNEINIYLRDKVGCRKKTKDGKNYSFTKDDDPGIMYIPEKMPDKSYASNAEHVITVIPPTKKTFKTSYCMVVFRPVDDWKGEFGFDWLRNGDRGTEKYEPPLLTGGYDGSDEGLTGAEAKANIKKEYLTLKTELKSKPAYYVPYLNIYPEGAAGNPVPPFKATLKLDITVEEEAADTLTVKLPEYTGPDGKPASYFEIESGDPSLPKTVGTHEKEITIKCIKSFSTEQEITVVSETRETDGKMKTYVAGKIIACPNAVERQKNMKFIFIKVLTDSTNTGIPSKGSFTASEKDNLSNALFQALITGEFVDGPDLDLSMDHDFQKGTWKRKNGKFYISKLFSKKGVGLNQDHNQFFPTVKKLFLDVPGNDIYKNDFTVFAFGERPYDKALGQVQDIGNPNLIVFPNRDDCTTNHEVLHGLSLLHSFKSEPVEINAKFTFEEGKTDNVMDYTYDSSALITWKWQWQLLNK